MTRIITLTIIFALFAFGGCDDKRLGPEHPGHNNGSGDVQEETTLCELVDAVSPACVNCHATGATFPDLSSAEAWLAMANAASPGLPGEILVVPNDAENSLLFKKVAYTKEELSAAELRQPMPLPNGGLDASLVEGIRLWIENGASGDCNSNDTQNQGANDAGSSPQNPGNPADAGEPGQPGDAADAGTDSPQGSGDGGPLATLGFCDLEREIFGPKCAACHGANATPPDLTLDGVLTALVNVESSSYPGHTYVVPHDPSTSLIYQKVAWTSEQLSSESLGTAMPMTYTGIDYPLTPQEIADIASWIDQGAPVPAGCD